MANEIVASTTSSDQEKMLAARLIQRSHLKLVAKSLCDPLQMKEGTGLTAYFVRYKRMNIPLSTISEGVDPSNSTFALDGANVTLDQWGDVITITDVAQLTTKHPLLQQAMDLLADNAARVMDREVQLVMLAGTNVQYGDGSISSRSSLTAADLVSNQVIHKARVTLVNAGVPPRDGPAKQDAQQVQAAGSVNGSNHFVAVAGPEVMADIMQSGVSLGTFAAVATYSNEKALYNAEVGIWLGMRWVECNFIPRFTLLGNATAAVVSGQSAGISGMVITAVNGGGSLKSATTFFFKITRKDLLRGFEEAISIAHSMASEAAGDNESFTFALPSTAGYVYNIYFDTEAAGGTGVDAQLKLSAENQDAGDTVTVTANPSSGATPPSSTPTAAGATTVHPIYILGAEALNWVGFYGIQVMVTKDESIIGNVLKLKRAVGYKFFGKAMIRDQDRILRVEVVSGF